MLRTRPLVIALSVLPLTACDAAYRDISSEDAYRPLIGAICKVQKPLNAYGVAKKLERQKEAALVTLSALKLSGPEFTFSTIVGEGTKLQVLSVRQCTNCPVEVRVEYRVRVQPEPPEFRSKPVYLAAEPMLSGQVVCEARKDAA